MLGAAAVTSAELWGAVLSIAFSILTGAVLMGWRLGRLEGKVETTLAEHGRRLDRGGL